MGLQEQLKEAEQGLLDAQEKVIVARQSWNQVNSHVALIEREKKRAGITLKELGSLDGSHKAYKSIGRMFVLTPVPALTSELKEKAGTCDEELRRLAERQQAAKKGVEDSETQFRKQFQAF
eukprot:EG_transcript_48998